MMSCGVRWAGHKLRFEPSTVSGFPGQRGHRPYLAFYATNVSQRTVVRVLDSSISLFSPEGDTIIGTKEQAADLRH